jgi:DNA-binding SARP family transcriptional activator
MLTELGPYRETGHRILMEALERRGNLAEALRAYERLRALLREELGIAPNPDLQAVHRRLLRRADD